LFVKEAAATLYLHWKGMPNTLLAARLYTFQSNQIAWQLVPAFA
jgi:hypothetical protein